MSTNKIMALIGAITYSFMPFLMLIIAAGASTAQYQSEMAGTSTSASLVAGIYSFLAFVTFLIAAANWVAFALIDGKHGQAWKIYLLVSGILSALSIIGLIPGVLFILAFALRGKPKAVSADEADGAISWQAPIAESIEPDTNEPSSDAREWTITKQGKVELTESTESEKTSEI
ncbi:MAG: hypothetical protein LBI11_06405 [Streptococcaceae bacterium]|jgi:hypothetical protein|nr:hypothetical protein [Streptococcaceae bacterium]